MRLQLNPSFKDDFYGGFMQVSPECLWLYRGKIVQEERKEKGKRERIKEKMQQ